MADIPEIKIGLHVAQRPRDSTAAAKRRTRLSPPAIMAAVFDATGVMPRRIPLTPAYVQQLLKA